MNRIIRIKKYLILPLLLLVTLGMNRTIAQDKITVHGTVKDEQQNALVGVTIVATATKTGVATDLDGKFELTCPAGAELKISYVGYKNQTLKADAKMSITLLSDEVGIDEVIIVAVGYGTMRKKDLTGSITTVSADQFKKGVVNSSEQLLQGKVAGLTVIQGDGNPAMGSSIRLRGGTSLSASNGPLVVVDGVPGVDFNTVQPSEIVSIDVLKDASAAAIYGSRGANGVIIVTTNRETKGKTMEYSGYAGFGTVAKNLDLLSANQWRQNVRDNNIKSAVDYGGDTDWQKELEQNSFSQSHSLSFSSANENSGYRASFNYLDSEGIIKKSYLNRMGISISAFQYGLNDRLKLEFSLHANTDKWSNPDYTIFDRAFNLNPTIPVMQNGKYTQVGGTNNNNPVELLENRTDENSRKRILGYGKAEYKILEGLKAVANVSYEFNGAEGAYYLPSYAFNEITDKGYGRRNVADYTTMQLETYLNYERKIMDFGKLNALAGYSYLDNVYSGFGSERRGFDTDEFTFNNLAAGQDYRSGDVYSYKGKANLISFYGRVNATVKDRYMLTATLRRDGSSRFGENNKWGLFPSVSVGWRVSDESFMENAKSWLNNLKIRAGYGVTGNQDGIGEYKSLFLLGAGGASYFDATSGKWKQSYGAIQNPNPDLKWESTAQLNIGVDFSLWNRLSGTLEVYSKKTSDLLYTYDVPQPPYLYGTMLANVGDLSNKGIELSLNGSIMKRKDFRWDANLTMAHNVQKVDRLSNQIYQTDVVNSGSLHGLTGMSTVFSQILKEGYAVGTFWGPKCLGVDADGKFILANDGAPEVIGNAQPKLTVGFSTDLSYKNFELNISTYGMFGQSVLNATAMNISYPGRLPGYNVMDSFLKSGIKSDPVYSSYWIEDASFLRLQSVSLGYNVPLKKMAVKKLNVYITGENLFVFTNYKGIDPEISIDGLSRPGIDILSYYPKPRTILLGVKMSF
jgi:iron complex outermembrane receptor protein